ncbi:MAG: hypothetical protein ACFFEA_11745 [Candidatus Thorarchaeota archaeon]
MQKISEEDFKQRYFEIMTKPLPEDPEQIEFLYERIVTLIEFTVARAEYYENIRQENASTSNALVGLAIAGLGLIYTIVTESNWMYHPATYLFVPPLLVLLIGGTISVFRHHLDSRFEYPHQKYDWIEERWYFKKNIPAFEKLLKENETDTKKTQDAFLSDLEREFNRNTDISMEKAIPLDKANLVILYIVTAYKKKFAKLISNIHTWSFILAGLVLGIFAVYYSLFVIPFVP